MACLLGPPAELRAAPVTLRFVAADARFEAAAAEYRRVWRRDGARLAAALERYSGVPLPEARIRVIVFERTSSSGRHGGPMRMRASYAEPVKRATLAHELLHRHLDELPALAACFPEIHDPMSVLLFELWTELWGREFALQQARVEAARSERYRRSWARALGMDAAARRAELATLAACRTRPTEPHAAH